MSQLQGRGDLSSPGARVCLGPVYGLVPIGYGVSKSSPLVPVVSSRYRGKYPFLVPVRALQTEPATTLCSAFSLYGMQTEAISAIEQVLEQEAFLTRRVMTWTTDGLPRDG